MVTDRLSSRVPADPSVEQVLAVVVTALTVIGSVLFVGAQLHPELIVADTTPTGGDMGSHVWAPAFLRDHLLGDLRLSGWTPDWYAGFPLYQFYMVVPALLILALDLVLPYGIAFKLVAVSGIVALPLAAWAMGRLARLPFPVPAAFAVAMVAFIFDRSHSIYGGNAAAMLAGEFSFAISLSLALVYLGVVARGITTGRHRALAAVLLALAVLCHVIPATFAVAGTVLLVAVRPGFLRAWWAISAGAAGSLLAGFWALPFLWRQSYMTDMEYEQVDNYLEHLFPGRIGDSLTSAFGGAATADIRGDLTWVIVLALVGAGTSIAFRRRFGIFLVGVAAVFAFAFVLDPVGRLWNARLLPFWYLALHLLAALAVAEIVAALSVLLAADPDRPNPFVRAGATAAAVLVVLGVIALPLRALPFGRTVLAGGEFGGHPAETYQWPGFAPESLRIETTDDHYVDSWAKWNFEGYERKDAWPEYRGILATMRDVGEEHGCGRAMWDYEYDKLNRYGTPMAMMLLPYWTEGCIGSMEGLYFESSATTPYHFLNAAWLSGEKTSTASGPSTPVRNLPYGTRNVAEGVRRLQLLGVRYYLAFSEDVIDEAAQVDDLRLLATSEGGWHVYLVDDAALVRALEREPVVAAGVPDAGPGWQEMAVDWYVGDDREVLWAASGPDRWDEATPGSAPRSRSLPPVDVTRIQRTTDSISFEVDRVGVPVLVKESYFPSWSADGADGPYRVTPNLMVVVPTEREVTLRYERTAVDWLGWFLTLAGVAAVVVLVRRRPLPLSTPAEVAPEANQPHDGAQGPAGDRGSGGAPLHDGDGELGHPEAGPLGLYHEGGVEQVGAEGAGFHEGGESSPAERLDPVGVADAEPEAETQEPGEGGRDGTP